MIISDTECAAALSVRPRSAAIDEPVRTAITDPFETPLQQVPQTVPISSSHFPMAAHVARHTQPGPRAGDALHMAIAAETGSAICTTDKRLASAATEVGVTVGYAGFRTALTLTDLVRAVMAAPRVASKAFNAWIFRLGWMDGSSPSMTA